MVETSRAVVALVALVAVVGAVPALAVASPLSGAGPASQVDGADAAGAQSASIEPGARLSGVVGVQQAELEGEVSARAFGQRVAAAATNESKAKVLGATVETLDERLAALEAEKADLERALENGTLSQGQYRSELAKLHVRERALERLANRTGEVAARLPNRALAAQGVDPAAVDRIRTRARNLTGPEVAADAREIAGRGVGNGIGPPDRAGPPGRNGSAGPGNGQGNGDGGPGNDPGNSDGSPGNGDGGPGNGDGSPGDGGAGDGAPGNDGNPGDGGANGGPNDGGPNDSGQGGGPPDDSGDGAGGDNPGSDRDAGLE